MGDPAIRCDWLSTPDQGGVSVSDLTFCPQFHRAVELIGRRWTGVILRAMMGGAVRFSDISGSIPGLSDRLLSERLKELEGEGIVRRTVYPETPVRIEYTLTDKGLALGQTIAAIATWAERWGTAPADSAASETERAERPLAG
jgi:DNA-binding HxlR family transcriptional regulator